MSISINLPDRAMFVCDFCLKEYPLEDLGKVRILARPRGGSHNNLCLCTSCCKY